MGKHYVTFGQDHRHEICGKVFDKDCVAVFNVASSEAGREVAFSVFGTKFCFEYSEEYFNFGSMRSFPRGFVELTTAEILEVVQDDEGMEEPIQADPADPAEGYTSNSELILYTEYADLSLEKYQHLSRLRQLVEGMAPSYNKTMCLKALQDIAEDLRF